MTEFLDRQSVLHHKKNLKAFIIQNQNEYISDMLVDCDSISEEKESYQELLKILDFDVINFKKNKEKFREFIFSNSINNLDGFLENVKTKFSNVLENLDIKSMDFLFETKSNWKFKNIENFKSLQNYNEFSEHVYHLSNTNNSKVIKVDLKSLPYYLSINFYSSRYCTSLPRLLFSPDNDLFIGFTCKYGNFHIYTNNDKNEVILENHFIKNDYFLINQNDETDRFNI